VALGVAALVGIPAFRSSRATRKQLDVLLDDREREHDERRREQAAQVSAWMMIRSKSTSPLIIVLQNASHLPIYDVTFWLWAEDQRFRLTKAPIVGPTTEPSCMEGMSERLTEYTKMSLKMLMVHLRNDRLSLELTFRDSSNVHWRRDSHGVLVEIDRPSDSADMPE
jgi:hypothetical protein